jgi:hypothetical protein
VLDGGKLIEKVAFICSPIFVLVEAVALLEIIIVQHHILHAAVEVVVQQITAAVVEVVVNKND